MKKITDETVRKFREHLINEEKSRATTDKYIRDLKAFASWLGGEELSKTKVLEYKKHLTENYVPVSVNSILSSLNSFFEYAEEFGLKVKNLKIQKQIFAKVEKELTKAEYERLLKAAKSKGNRKLNLIMQTICATGIRVSELRYINVESLKEGRAKVNMKGKMRVIVIPDELCRMLKKYAAEQKISGGSNMHAGLLAANEILNNDKNTADSRKYVVLVSDGLIRLFTGSDGKTKDIYYQYTYSDPTGEKRVGTGDKEISPKNCVYFGMIDEWTRVRTKQAAARLIPYGDWDTYFSKVRDWVKADGDTYALNYETYGNDPTDEIKNKENGDITDQNFKYIGHNDYDNHAMAPDRAVYEAYNSFTKMTNSGFHCYAVLPGSGTPFGTAFMGAMNSYAKNGENVDFNNIGTDILYAVGACSVIEDIMEATNSHEYVWTDAKNSTERWTKKLSQRDWLAMENELFRKTDGGNAKKR